LVPRSETKGRNKEEQKQNTVESFGRTLRGDTVYAHVLGRETEELLLRASRDTESSVVDDHDARVTVGRSQDLCATATFSSGENAGPESGLVIGEGHEKGMRCSLWSQHAFFCERASESLKV
jgi:hypothetical protein